MRIPGRKFIRKLLRPIATRFFPGALVLGYHRVADIQWDPLRLAVGTKNFREQLRTIGRRRQIVALEELVRRSEAGESIEQYAAITFDDGYRDFADNVLPILKEEGVPATVFVATGFTGGDFWWEQVTALLDPAFNRESSLDIDTGTGETRAFDHLGDPDAAARAAASICHDLRDGDPLRVSAVLGQLREWTGTADPRPDSGQPLAKDQLTRLGGEPLVGIGAHTVRHGCLADMDTDAQWAEIQRSRSELESLVGEPVMAFSYPNGSYSEETPELVRQAGFLCACASTEGLYRRSGSRFRIPRLWVSDVGGAGFRTWLEAWIGQGR